jgi:hypothetical protein
MNMLWSHDSKVVNALESLFSPVVNTLGIENEYEYPMNMLQNLKSFLHISIGTRRSSFMKKRRQKIS